MPPPNAAPARQAKLKIVDMPGPAFLQMVTTFARSPDTDGSIKSQYEKELSSGNESVFVVSVSACDKTVAAMSCGIVPLPRSPGTISGRIDAVVTRPEARGQGLGSIVMAGAIQQLYERYGKNFRHCSVMAVHPAIARFVTACGFKRAGGVKVPLYDIDLEDDAEWERLRVNVNHQVDTRFCELKTKCLECKRFTWAKPWCVEPTQR